MRELNEMFTGHWGKLMEALVDGDLIGLLGGRDIDVDVSVRQRGRTPCATSPRSAKSRPARIICTVSPANHHIIPVQEHFRHADGTPENVIPKLDLGARRFRLRGRSAGHGI